MPTNQERAQFGRTRRVLYILLAVMVLAPGCQCWKQVTTDFASQTTGLNRTVRVYDYNGHLLHEWRSRTVIDADSGGLTTFFDSTGCRILVNGGILISVETP